VCLGAGEEAGDGIVSLERERGDEQMSCAPQ
jgi:hypothetical protein